MNTPDSPLYRQFKVVFDAYYNSLCNYAFTFTKNADSSEDIVQDLFARIWEDRRELLTEKTIRFYLFTAVRNNSISWLRQGKRGVTVEWDERKGGYAMIGTEEADSRETMDHSEILKRGIDRLPPKCREVFLLNRFSNMSYKEIAASLGISVKTVENQLGKALKVLRAFLKENGVYLAWAVVNIFL
jgi:RNA polymerase sigma-70 factor (family 1)